MKVTGIIAECNPLHEGHIYLLQEARKRTDADYVIVALSGDYVQRGAPSIVSKELRTEALLREGADLVLELPLYAACAGADYFARGAAALLESTGVVTDLAFGSEAQDSLTLRPDPMLQAHRASPPLPTICWERNTSRHWLCVIVP